MRAITRLVVATLVLAAGTEMVGAAVASADWSPTPSTQLNSAGTSGRGVAAASVAGVPYIAWSESTDPASSAPAYMERLENGSFARVGSALSDCARPFLADVGGTPYVACQGNSSSILVYSLQGSDWAQVGPSIAANPDTQPLGGIADVGGQPAVAYQTSAGGVEVDTYSSGSWSALGNLIAPPAGTGGHVGFSEFAQGPSLVGDGSTPIVAFSELKSGSSPSQFLVFADQLQGSTWTPLNGDQPLNPVASDSAYLDGVTMVGSTPYVGLDDASSSTNSTDVLALSGASFQPVGGPLNVSDGPTSDLSLGAYNGAPLAVSSETGTSDFALTARTLSGGTWGKLGSPLGVPPLPGSEGTPYAGEAIALDASSDTPYVIFLQQPPGNGEPRAENVFAEGFIAGATAPTAPAQFTSNPPTSTISFSATSLLPAASVELAGDPSLRRRGRSLRVGTGLRASCPTATGRPACAGVLLLSVRSHGKTYKVKAKFKVPSGRTVTVTATFSAAITRQLRKRRHKGVLRAKLTASVTGPNRQAASLTQSLDARLR